MPPAPSGNSPTAAVVGGVAGGAALLFATLAIALAYWQRKKPQDHYFDVPAEEDPYDIHQGQLKQFSLVELQVATNNFSKDNILRKGAFWKVYKGRLADGSQVAVKRLEEKHTEGQERQFETEVKMINMAVHRNLLQLRGFCMTPTERLLVFPFMVNRSVAWYLRERPKSQPPLDWTIRKHVALGAARGLAYLHDHCDRKIIHRDVNPSNILLDEKFEAIVGYFGLSKLMDYNGTNVTTAVCGTIGYIAPEYLSTGKVSEKIDVFGYGVMLFELITGQTARDLARLANDNLSKLLDWVKGFRRYKRLGKLVDVDLQGNYDEEEVKQLIQLAFLCTQGSPMGRPKMSEVVRMIEGDGLADKWEQYCQREETLEYDFNNIRHPNFDGIVDSTSSLQPGELSERHSNSTTTTVAGGVAAGAAMLFSAGAALLCAAPAIALACRRRKKTQDEKDLKVLLGKLKQFSLHELKVATDNFSNKNILGRGSFGQVYKVHLADGSLVAVKRLKEEGPLGGELQFQTEVKILSMAVHRNLLQLHGFCMTRTERLLVYPFMANKSVAWHLRESQPTLDWPTRKRISLEVARGLAYLHDHCDPMVIHRDVKAENILLNEEFEAVIGDFGLAKFMDYRDTYDTTVICGTMGHIPPEYFLTGKISEKTDVFGYGVMLLELITRRKAFDDDVMLLDWVKGLLRDKRLDTLMDANLQGNYNEEEVERLMKVALLCTQDPPSERPKMSEVIIMLQGDGLVEVWEQYCHEEETQGYDFINIHHHNSNWIVESASSIQTEELSGP